MVTEIATLNVAEGKEEAFAQVMNETGCAALASLTGATSVRFGRGIENPSKFGLVIEWDSVEAHIAATTTEAFKTFGLSIRPFTTGGTMEHFALS